MAERRHPRSRAGSRSTARTSASSASKVMPISRNGSVKSQTTGKRISASRAKGQQSTNRMHQPTKRIRAFTSLSFHHATPRQCHAAIISFWLGKLAIRYESGLTSRSVAVGAETYQRGLIGWAARFLAAEETHHQRNRYSAARNHTEAGPLLRFGEIRHDF
jgi:hypothetical protein